MYHGSAEKIVQDRVVGPCAPGAGEDRKGMAMGAFMVLDVTLEQDRQGNTLYYPFADRMRAIVSNVALLPEDAYWLQTACFLVGILRERGVSLEQAGFASPSADGPADRRTLAVRRTVPTAVPRVGRRASGNMATVHMDVADGLRCPGPLHHVCPQAECAATG